MSTTFQNCVNYKRETYFGSFQGWDCQNINILWNVKIEPKKDAVNVSELVVWRTSQKERSYLGKMSLRRKTQNDKDLSDRMN